MLKSANVAMPWLGLCVVVPLSLPAPGLLSIATRIRLVTSVSTTPVSTSLNATVTAGVIGAPAAVLAGC